MSKSTKETQPQNQVRSIFPAYVEAVLVVTLFTVARQLFSPFLGTLLPFTFFFLATAIVLWRRGTGPAVFAAALGYVCARIWIYQPTPSPFTYGEFVQTLSYVILSALLIGLSHVFRARGSVAKAHAEELSSTADKLDIALSTGRTVAFEWDLTNQTVRLFGPAEELLGLKERIQVEAGLESVVLEDREKLTGLITEATDTGLPFATDVRFIHPKTGDLRWFATKISPQRDSHGKVTVLVGAATDITEYRDAERRKDEFLATLAHELRNPLAPIIGGLDLATHTALEPEVLQKTLQMMQRQASTISQLVDGLMDLSRISHGKLALNMETCDIRTCLQYAVEVVEPLARGANQTLTVSLPDTPILVNGDPLRLSQTFSNLAMNAYKFTPNGGTITLEARQDGEEAIVVVADTGVGIAPSHLGEVFERFAQPHGSPTHRPVGLGVGLSLCQEIIGLHGGIVTAESEGVNKGSRFTVRLRAIAGEKPSTVAVVHAPEVEKGIKRVLVVDDNRDAADVLGLLLRSAGHEVVVCYSASDGLKERATFAPEVILVDLGMPEMDGFEMAKAIQDSGQGQTPRLVAVTGWGQDSDLEMTKKAGFDAHLVKPATLDDIKAALY